MKNNFGISIIAAAFVLMFTGCTRKMEGDKELRSYSVGYALGTQLANVRDDVIPEYVARGLKDGINKEPKVDEAELARRLQELNLKQREREAGSAAENLKKSLVFIEHSSQKVGIKIIEKGLLVESIEPGVGQVRSLKDEEEVWLKYVAKRADGSVIDQTNDPNGVKVRYKDIILPGIKKAVSRMPLGAKWTVYMSPEQGYGAEARPGVPSQSALIYEVTLLRVGSKKAPAMTVREPAPKSKSASP